MSSAPIAFDCTNCGASLHVDGSTRMVRCTYCRKELMLPKSIWLQLHPNPPKHAPPDAARIQVQAPRVGRGLVVALVVAGVALVVGAAATFAAIVGAVGNVTASNRVPSLTPSLGLNPIAAVGEACNGRRAACGADGQSQLACGPDGKMRVAETCRGPHACRASAGGKSVTCDATYAERNDPCDIDDDACSTDHEAELRCEAGKFAVRATCKGPDGCTLTPRKGGDGYNLSCDDHIADVGDPCFDAKRTACSSDKKELLTCTAQRFAVARACHGGCTVKKIVGTDTVDMSCR